MHAHGLMRQARHGMAILIAAALLFPTPLPARDFFLQDGTEINLRLHTTVDSKISQAGDRIIATVEDAVSIDNVEVIPVGAGVAFIWFKGKHVELPAGTGLVMRVDRGVAFAVPDMPRPAGSR